MAGSIENHDKVKMHRGDTFQIELIMTLAIRNLQNDEIEDFSILYQVDGNSSIIIKYQINKERYQSRLLVTSSRKAIQQHKIKESLIKIMKDANAFQHVILYTNTNTNSSNDMEIKSPLSPMVASSLKPIGIIQNCYAVNETYFKRIIAYDISDKENNISGKNREAFEEYHKKFVLAFEQPDVPSMRKEIQAFLQSEYPRPSDPELWSKQIYYRLFHEVHGWCESGKVVTRSGVKRVLEFQVRELESLSKMMDIRNENVIDILEPENTA